MEATGKWQTFSQLNFVNLMWIPILCKNPLHSLSATRFHHSLVSCKASRQTNAKRKFHITVDQISTDILPSKNQMLCM